MNQANSTPQSQDLQLNSASQAQGRIVTQPNFLVRTFEYIANNPVNFALSTVASIAVRAGFIAFLGPSIASVIAAAMLTSIVLSVGKEMISAGPSEAELANANNVEVGGGVFSETLSKALISGAIAGVLGFALGPVAEAFKLDTAATVVDSNTVADSAAAPTATADALIDDSTRYVPSAEVEQQVQALRVDPVNYYSNWKTEFLQGDELVSRDASARLSGTGIDRATNIPNEIGYDKLDAENVRRMVFRQEDLIAFPEEILSPNQSAIFDGKTIVVDVGDYQIADTATGRYDLGAVYDANGDGVFEGMQPHETTFETTINGKNYTAITGLVDAQGDHYTFKTIGPAFTEDGVPVAIEAHVNLRNAIEYGEQARAMGADVVYTNLGRLEAGNATESLEYRRDFAQNLADAGHTPDMVVSFQANAGDATEGGLNVFTPAETSQESDDLSRLISNSSNEQAHTADMPFTNDGVPSVVVNMANLANPADNEMARLYSHERIPAVLRGTADYLIEQEHCITLDDKQHGAATATGSPINSITDLLPIPPIEDMELDAEGNPICVPGSLCDFLHNYEAPEPIFLDDDGVQITGDTLPPIAAIPILETPLVEIIETAAVDSLPLPPMVLNEPIVSPQPQEPTGAWQKMLNKYAPATEVETKADSIPPTPVKDNYQNLLDRYGAKPDNVENSSKVDTLMEDRIKNKYQGTTRE